MQPISFGSEGKFKYAILIKSSSFRRDSIYAQYVAPLVTEGISKKDIVAFPLQYTAKNKCNPSQAKTYLHELMPLINSLGVELIYCADSVYFKALVKETSAEKHLGYVLEGKFDGTESMDIIYGINYSSIFYNPLNQEKLKFSLDTWVNHTIQDTRNDLGKGIIHSANYPRTVEDIATALKLLHVQPVLTADIETFSLKHWLAGIGSCSFAWSKHSGIAFLCDYLEDDSEEGLYGKQIVNVAVRKLLFNFFCTYTGKIVWHNSLFDIRVIIYTLWMQDIQDRQNMLIGLETMTERFEDTQLIAYVSLNSCAGNDLSLKTLAHSFAGNYAQNSEDIKDIRRIPPKELLEYNLIDALSTFYVYEVYGALMDKEKQRDVYAGIFKESAVSVLEISLTGAPINMARVVEVKAILSAMVSKLQTQIASCHDVTLAERALDKIRTAKDYEKRKEKAKKPEAIKVIERKEAFNPQSGTQIAFLLHDVLGLPVLNTTDSGLPSTDMDTLEALVNHTDREYVKELLRSLLELSQAQKILSTFIPALEGSVQAPDGHHYLFGDINITGTISGRLSSRNPNLQNMPSTSTYAKLIKYCFQAHPSEVFAGADFNALEDVVNTLLTRDPNKEKILLEGYDSHSFKSYHYNPQAFPYVKEVTPQYINLIKTHDEQARSDDKPKTFALQYFGTYRTLMTKCGLDQLTALTIEANHKKLYQVSMQWVDKEFKKASEVGYVTLAFGLKLRTPMLSKVIWGSGKIPNEAMQESRSAGNAVSGQSYGLLNNRACNEFLKRVRNSPFRLDIKVCLLIHDAIYPRIANNYAAAEWCNRNLVECMQWQELPELHHDQIKLNANLDLYPSWDKAIELPNNASIEEIHEVITAFKEKENANNST